MFFVSKVSQNTLATHGKYHQTFTPLQAKLIKDF